RAHALTRAARVLALEAVAHDCHALVRLAAAGATHAPVALVEAEPGDHVGDGNGVRESEGARRARDLPRVRGGRARTCGGCRCASGDAELAVHERAPVVVELV